MATTAEPINEKSDEPTAATTKTQPQLPPPPPEASTTTATASDSKEVLTVQRPPEVEFISIPSYSSKTCDFLVFNCLFLYFLT